MPADGRWFEDRREGVRGAGEDGPELGGPIAAPTALAGISLRAVDSAAPIASDVIAPVGSDGPQQGTVRLIRSWTWSEWHETPVIRCD